MRRRRRNNEERSIKRIKENKKREIKIEE